MKNKTFYYFCKLIKKDITVADYKPILLRLSVLTESHAKTTFTNKLFFVVLSVCLPFLVLLRLKYDDSESIFFDTMYNEDRNRKRSVFIKHYVEKTDISLAAGMDNAFYYSEFKFSHIAQLLKLWRITIQVALFNLFWTTNSWKPIFLAVINCVTGILQQNIYKDAYVFSLYYPSSYLTAFVLSRYTKIKMNLISGNAPLYEMRRYNNLPEASLILCSKYQMEEYKAYSKLKWTIVKDVTIWGLEEQVQLAELEVPEPLYDIGIFSDASWARENGTWRSKDIEKIRSGVLKDNFKFESLDMIITTCCMLKEKYGLSVKVYLHPFERELMKVHSINPPYVSLLEEHNISFSHNGKNSLENIYESKIGVSTWSTIIMDRWHLDLIGLIHFEERQRAKPFNNNPDYFGAYKKFVFTDSMDLESKIIEFMKLKNIQMS